MEDQINPASFESTPVLPSSVGSVLSAAREAAGLSVEDIAQKLRLSPKQILSIETNQPVLASDMAFVRGFVRNYARLLQLDADSLVQSLKQQTMATAEPVITLASENIMFAEHVNKGRLKFALIAAFLLVIGLVAWAILQNGGEDKFRTSLSWFHSPFSQPSDQSEPNPESKPAAEPLVSENAQPVQIPVSPAVAESAVPDPASSAPVVPNDQSVAAANAAVQNPAGLSHIKFTFGESSWVDVFDQSGKELLNKTQAAGTVAELDALPPIKLTIGNAKGVTLELNSKPVDLASSTHNNVVHLTLDKDTH